jgi:hypothetical protein
LDSEPIGAGTSFVEIDLINRPNRVCVVHAHTAKSDVYRVSLRARLPVVQVPLRENDAEASLDLQTLIDAAYENGSYDRTDYSKEPVPPLNEDDSKWADELLRGKGLRS